MQDNNEKFNEDFNQTNNVIKYSKLSYILCAFFLGLLGIHSFVAGKKSQGVLFIVVTIIGAMLSIIGIGSVILSIETIIIIIQIIMAASKHADEYGRIS